MSHCIKSHKSPKQDYRVLKSDKSFLYWFFGCGWKNCSDGSKTESGCKADYQTHLQVYIKRHLLLQKSVCYISNSAEKNVPEKNQLLILLISLLSHFISRPVYLLIRNLMMNFLSYFLIRSEYDSIDFNLDFSRKEEDCILRKGDFTWCWAMNMRNGRRLSENPRTSGKLKVSNLLYIHCKLTVFRIRVEGRKNIDEESRRTINALDVSKWTTIILTINSISKSAAAESRKQLYQKFINSQKNDEGE